MEVRSFALTLFRLPALFSFSFPSAEERSDVSTRVQCRGQGATSSPAVSVAEPGDVHVDQYTSSVLMLAFIFREASSDFLPQGKLSTSGFTAGKKKFPPFYGPVTKPEFRARASRVTTLAGHQDHRWRHQR